MKRFESIMNIPSPYRVYLFEALARQLDARGWSYRSHFMAKGHSERPRSWLSPKMNFDYRYWKDFGKKTHHLNPGWMLRSLFVRPDVLLVGSPFDTFTGIFAAFFSRAKVKCTWVEGQTKTPGKMDGPIGAFKRLVLSRFRFVAVPGRDAAKYIEMHQARTWLKMPQPVLLPNLIDESRFRPRAEWPAEEVARCRADFGAKENEKVCLIPARLDRVKGLVPFLEAVDAELVKAGWRIVVMGQGPCKSEICAVAERKGIRDRLVILDYVPYDQMPVAYASADLFVLPSIHDPNPLSVPEALHSGLPVALSDRCGNVEEGVTDGENGWRLSVSDHELYAAQLRAVFSAGRETLVRMGCRSKDVQSRFWNTDEAIGKFLEHVL